MLNDKAMIIIAVSKYVGAYNNLPGTLESARRLREWAEQPKEDCNYKVLYLGDDVFPQINVELIRQEVSNFVDNNIMDRLVVYFAGHGIVRSAGDQFWLLTNAANDLREGINVEAFRRGLLKCNIGKYNDELTGQLCIIGDACRNSGRDAIEFYGDPILTRDGRKNRIQLDRFLSTGLGDYSFQINGIDGQQAYCLFSEVLLNALTGEIREAIETEYHMFQPAVTNHSLADYLEEEVKARAAAINEEMEPDLLTDIRPPYNFYNRLSEPLPSPTVGLQNSQMAQAIEMSVHDPQINDLNNQQTRDNERRRQILLKDQLRILSNPIAHRWSEDRSTICDYLPSLIAVPSSSSLSIRSLGSSYQIEATSSDGAPMLIRQGKQWMLTPDYPGVVSFIIQDLPGDVLLYKPVTDSWQTFLSDFSNLVSSATLRAAEAKVYADSIRRGKEEFPHQSVTAGYLYEFSNDYDNIARTAYFMARGSVLPFDLALLCADKIKWRKENGKVVAYADLPAVQRSQENGNTNYRPHYATTEVPELKNVPLWGIAPIFRQGWSFMQTERYLDIPDSIRLISEKMSGRSATSLTSKGFEMFIEAFDYKIIEIDSQMVDVY